MKSCEYRFNSDPKVTNFVFLGEAGCGKSELALTLAMNLKAETGKEVCLFDLDMTKPLFRSRDLAALAADNGVNLMYVEQFEDAPITGGWVDIKMRDPEVFCVLDVGGDYMGARAIGGYRNLLNTPETDIYYVINPYRPWSDTIEHVDGVLSPILSMSGIRIEKLKMLANPYIGEDTGAEDVMNGFHKVHDMISSYKEIEAVVIPEDLVGLAELPVPSVTVRKRIIYP